MKNDKESKTTEQGESVWVLIVEKHDQNAPLYDEVYRTREAAEERAQSLSDRAWAANKTKDGAPLPTDDSNCELIFVSASEMDNLAEGEADYLYANNTDLQELGWNVRLHEKPLL